MKEEFIYSIELRLGLFDDRIIFN